MRCSLLMTRIEFEYTRNHHDCFRVTPILEHRETKCLRAVNEKSATHLLLVLDDPVSTAVLADQEDLGAGFERGRLRMFHDTFP
jgi:hypothetical protein